VLPANNESLYVLLLSPVTLDASLQSRAKNLAVSSPQQERLTTQKSFGSHKIHVGDEKLPITEFQLYYTTVQY